MCLTMKSKYIDKYADEEENKRTVEFPEPC